MTLVNALFLSIVSANWCVVLCDRCLRLDAVDAETECLTVSELIRYICMQRRCFIFCGLLKGVEGERCEKHRFFAL